MHDNTGVQAAAPSYLGRMAVYFREMFPLHQAALASLLIFFSFFLFMAQADGLATLFYAESWYAILTLFLYYIIFRLNDELKDEEFDKVHNPTRPLVTGRTKYSDIKIAIVVLFFVILALNFNRGFVTSAFLVWVVFLTLSARWFYFPDEVRHSFLLTTITHQPMLPLTYFYVYAVYLSVTGAEPNYMLAIPLFLLFSLNPVGWEVARKTRAPEQETTYPTYSQKWGVRRAALFPTVCTAVVAVGLALIGFIYDFSLYFVLGSLALGLAASVSYGAFLHKPEAARNRQRKTNELFDLGFRLLIIVEVLVRFAAR